MTAVFVVEDDQALREVLCEALGDEGYAVYVCDDFSQVLAQAHADDLALVDACGPSEAHLEDGERRSIQRLAASVPTIMLTGRAWAEHEQADALGLMALVLKPPDLNSLLELLQRQAMACA
jgi:DNA-binding response OmpR family regulator